MLCDPCCRMVEELLDQDRSNLDDNPTRSMQYQAAAELEDRCVVCQRLFEQLQSHLIYRHVFCLASGLGNVGVTLVIEAMPKSGRDWGSPRTTGNPAFCIEPWRASSSFGPGAAVLTAERPDMLVVPESTGDPRCLSLASTWLELCVKNHAKCNERYEAGYRPPRLLRLNEGSVCLVSGSDLPPDIPIRYAALSYCWGELPTFLRLSNINEPELRRGVPLDELPPLMRDVFEAARGLSLEYVWIDCLCIQQDGAGSEADWEVHVQEMRSVYQNCFVNIAAASALCPGERLFQRRTPHEVLQASFKLSGRGSDDCSQDRLFTVRHHSRLEQQLSKETLSKRGWVLQERMMSPRCLSFGKKQIFWECSITTACEAFPQGYEANGQLDVFDVAPLGSIRDDDAENLEPTGREKISVGLDLARHGIIENYTDKSLSMPAKDKLVAIAAIMEAFNTVQGVPRDDYICGFLRRDLPQSMYWCMPKQRCEYDVKIIGTSEYRAPSWSWAANDYPCTFFHYDVEPFLHTSLLDAHWSLVDPQNPYGRVSAAKVVLRTRLLTVNRPTTESPEASDMNRAGAYDLGIEHPDYSWPAMDSEGGGWSSTYMNELSSCCVTLESGGSYNVHLGFDDGHTGFGDAAATRRYPVHLLPLSCYITNRLDGKGDWLVKGLVVRTLDEGKFGMDMYVRVGTFSMWPADGLQRSEQWIRLYGLAYHPRQSLCCRVYLQTTKNMSMARKPYFIMLSPRIRILYNIVTHGGTLSCLLDVAAMIRQTTVEVSFSVHLRAISAPRMMIPWIRPFWPALPGASRNLATLFYFPNASRWSLPAV